MAAIALRARAKLNLYLHILSRRADGYHTMESLVAFTDLADVLTIAPADSVTLIVEGEFADQSGNHEENLVIKAARALQEKTSVQSGARLTLTKNIPVGAGLGGGSADAAAALRGLNRFWELNLSQRELRELAASLGADVPMCLDSVPSIARGIGEELTPLLQPLPQLYAVLVHPRTPLLTKDVYAAFEQSAQAFSWSAHFTDAASFVASLNPTRNQLQQAAIRVDSNVAEVLLALETLQPAPDLVRMTGSGACCFALYSNKAQAEKATHEIKRHYPDWWVHCTSITPE
jgi:4-diphosphocytidyl-2-C-methyl-D-erythritol kinase